MNTFLPMGEGVAACRYGAQGLLVQASCGASSVEQHSDGRVLPRYGGTRVTVDLTGPPCHRGVRVDDGTRRALTPEVLYWALSP